MKLPRRVDYACRVLICLSQAPTGLARVEELAEKEQLSANYLVQILNELRTAGLVESRRGRQGGYKLSVSLEKISLLQVIEATEGKLLEAPHDSETTPEMYAMWNQVAEKLDQVLANTTLDNWVSFATQGDWMI